MPTTEERLAALEARMAAWMTQQPTTYYTHQYSGEEIDAAVGRALAGGALDTSVTNVSNQLGTFTRPNLLDNWYFGNPVDQRKGYVVYAGANLYSDASCTTIAGQVAGGPYAARAISAICVSFTSNATYYCKIGDTGVVRGYITNWNQYTIDRWSTEGNAGEIKVVVSTGCVDVTNMLSQSVDHSIQFKQILPTEICLPGKTYTLSVLTKNVVGSVSGYLAQSGAPYGASFEFPITSGLSTYTGVMIDGQQRVGFSLGPGASMSLIAAKLELGPTQTLAHKEGERWVLNEIPKYSRELLDCQMYNVKFGYADKYCILGSGVARDDTFVSITVPVPAELRTYPVVILTGVIIIRHSDVVNQACTTLVLDAIGVSSILLKIKASGLTPGDAYEAFLAPGNYLDVSCDL